MIVERRTDIGVGECMKIRELLCEYVVAQLSLKTDNPGGRWLDEKREDSEMSGRRPSGRYNVMGSTTGWYNREAFIPIEVLKGIPGTNQEQKTVRKDSLEYLVAYMDKHGKLPDAEWHQFNEYAPMVVVDQDGVPFVNEGNHRIMAAAEVGFKALPVEIKYFNGGEQEDGLLHPDKVAKYDSDVQKQGFTYGKYR